MTGYLTRNDWEKLQKGETKTVTFYTEQQARQDEDFMKHCGGAVRIGLREVSDTEHQIKTAGGRYGSDRFSEQPKNDPTKNDRGQP